MDETLASHPWDHSSSLNCEAKRDRFAGQRSVSSGQKSALHEFEAATLTLPSVATHSPPLQVGQMHFVLPFHPVPLEMVQVGVNITVGKSWAYFRAASSNGISVWSHWRLLCSPFWPLSCHPSYALGDTFSCQLTNYDKQNWSLGYSRQAKDSFTIGWLLMWKANYSN